MNIVLISTHLLPRSTGGVEVFTELLAKTFSRLGHRVTLYTGGWEKPQNRDGVRVVFLPELSAPLRLRGLLVPLYERLLRRRLSREAALRNADIVNAVDIDSITMLAGWEPVRKRFIATIHDYGLISATGLLLPTRLTWYQQIAHPIRMRYRSRKLALLTHAICVSAFVRRQIVKRAAHLHTEVIGNALPHHWWTKRRPSKQRTIDVLYVGRLEPFKGTMDLLVALARVVARHPHLKVVFAGGGRVGMHEQLARQLGIADHVSFVRNQPFQKIHTFFSHAKIVVVPSVWPEPCGRVIIEAMFWGAAVISTNRGGTPELITNGTNGLLVPASAPNRLADAIEDLLRTPTKRMALGAQAMRDARMLYRPDAIAKRYLRFYRSVLAST